MEVTNKSASFFFIHCISLFLSQIFSIIKNTHEAITQIPKNILQEDNLIDGLDAIIDRIIQLIKKK